MAEQIEALIERALNGDAAAFEALILHYQPRVASVLHQMGVAAQDVPDVAQTVFLRAFRSLGRFRRDGSLAGWIYRTAVNCAIDHRKRASARAEVPLDDPEFSTEPLDPRSDGGEAVALRDLARRALGGLHRLAERERAVFVLHDLQGLSSREVASALGMRTPTVRRHLASARAKLREWLGDANPFR